MDRKKVLLLACGSFLTRKKLDVLSFTGPNNKVKRTWLLQVTHFFKLLNMANLCHDMEKNWQQNPSPFKKTEALVSD